MTQAKTPRRKHVPMRTCVVCRQTRGKRDLVRIVRTPAGAVQIDPTGKVAGRGAYLCKVRGCWEQARTSDKLSAALKAHLSPADQAMLAAYAAALPETLATEA